MITISLCMIVKNEQRVLARCLESLKGLLDEIIIVDTGSTDRTREIAGKYTDKVYDFAWVNDFSAARNFAFSKASCEYIYSADADEVLDEENRRRFFLLKENLLPEIEIVQMYYGNQLAFGTIYNYDRELRPKLFKRMRPFVWTEAIHETVRLSPVVYDSDIEITHLPEKSHTDRDLASFHALTQKKEPLSERLFTIYAKELLISGRDADLLLAEDFFTGQADGDLPMERMKEALCVVVRAARIRGDYLKMYRYAMKDIASEGVSEVCFELGEYYFGTAIYEEAAMWFYNAAYETESILSIRCSGDLALGRLADCYEKMGLEGQARDYRKKAMDWKADGSFEE
ncbi:MAG: glycosyltransferase family 2 protein [Lachnospiraceae bacterium]|nr:glycosyltransferase family 2 protein [Lachnospiraceae bacterium]